MKEMRSVPMPIYENEMKSKNNIIKALFAFLFLTIIVLGVVIYMFMSFISAYDYGGYNQDGDGINNVNTGTQRDIYNESTNNSKN